MHRRARLLPIVLLGLLATLPACADSQEVPEAATSEPVAEAATTAPAASEWQVRADPGHAADEGFGLTEASPGWRISTGGFSGILWRTGQAGRGTYEAIATVHVLPGSRQTEGYGILLGGTELETDAQRYTYVLLRDDGKYLIKTRDGGSTNTVVDWTDAAAIRTLAESAGEGGSAANTIVVRVTPENLTLLINGERVHQRARGDLPLDGVVGLRINHGLELHVQSLDVGQPAAPAE